MLTCEQNVRRYNTLAMGQEMLESQLQGPMAEHLNAEIVLRTVTDVPQAIAWVCSTFMYIRVGCGLHCALQPAMQRQHLRHADCAVQVKMNPSYYGMPANLHTARSIEGALKDRVIMSTLRELSKHGLVLAQTTLCLA